VTSIVGGTALVGSYPVQSGGNTWPLLKYLGLSAGMSSGPYYAKFIIWLTGTTSLSDKVNIMSGYMLKFTTYGGVLGEKFLAAGQGVGTAFAGWGIGISIGCAISCEAAGFENNPQVYDIFRDWF
jgi:hypothetical protein